MLKLKSLWLRSVRPVVNRVVVQASNKRVLHSMSIVSDLTTNKLFNSNFSSLFINNIRQKSKKLTDVDSDDENDFFDDDNSLTKDSKVVKFSTTSLRTDTVLKSALGGSRNKIEQLFYESKIRVNGRKILKKSAPVRLDYEIDIIKHVSPKNPNHLYIARIEILNITAKDENINFTVRRFKNLLIENYEKDPYKSGETQATE